MLLPRARGKDPEAKEKARMSDGEEELDGEARELDEDIVRDRPAPPDLRALLDHLLVRYRILCASDVGKQDTGLEIALSRAGRGSTQVNPRTPS